MLNDEGKRRRLFFATAIAIGALTACRDGTGVSVKPVIAAIDPPTTLAGETTRVETIVGSGFYDNAVVNVLGTDRPRAPGYVFDATRLTFVLTTDDQRRAGSIPVIVTNPGGEPATASLSVDSAAPVLKSFLRGWGRVGDTARLDSLTVVNALPSIPPGRPTGRIWPTRMRPDSW